MSQQTSIYNFYRSVNPKSSAKKSVTHSPLKNNVRNKRALRLGKARQSASPSTPVKKSPVKLSPTKNEMVDVLDSDEEVDSKAIIKREFSCENESPETPTKGKNGRKRSSSRSSGTSTPRKKQLTNGSRAVIKHLKNRSPQKLFQETIDTGKVSEMIDNLNLSRGGVIPKSYYNLEQFYSGVEVKAEIVDCYVDDVSPSYDARRVIIPREKHAEHLFNIVTQVFSNPSNCGYFDDHELDKIFGILSLSEKSQSLFARMIKRKYCWRRAASIEYLEISQDLRPLFDELERHQLIRTNSDNESLDTLLTMLYADEVKEVCRQMKCLPKGGKEPCIQRLLKTSCIKPLFPGMESPAAVLRRTVLATLGHCVCLPEEVISLIDRVVTLFIPSEEVTTKLADIFLKLTMTKEGTLRFPEAPVQHYPVFQDREHLVRYVEGKNKWRKAMEPSKDPKENFDQLRTLGREAHTHLMLLLRQNPTRYQGTHLPRHVQKFREEYVYIKILTTCLDVFKKEESTLPEAVQILRDLISQESLLQGRKGEWYEQLALIEMRHKKDPETAALIIIEGLSLENIPAAARYDLTKRATTLSKRKGVSQDTKTQLENLIDKEIFLNTPKVTISGNALEGNQPGRKSTWSMDMGDGGKGYMSVEHRAQLYYKRNGYPEGWHCEGSLPITLFTLLFWQELYCVPVPAAYLSAYQRAPLDLYASDFYNNRKEPIDRRIEEIRMMSADELGDTAQRSLEIRQHYESLMPTTLFPSGEQLKDIVRCMGTPVVTGICKRLASNFCGWRAGFPDLLVWNPFELKCKFVEVKGPGDTLSSKQTLWLRYLEDLGASTELCELKAGTKKK